MRITLFDVEHGACALVTSSTGLHALLDCGHNSTTGWRPSWALPAIGVREIEEMFVTNYDEDHVSDLLSLRRVLPIRILTKNPTVSGQQLYALKTEDCKPGVGIAELISMTRTYTEPVLTQPNWGDISFETFYNSYPTDFSDENNLSMAVFVRHARLTVLFTGDLEKAGWRKLLQNPRFVALLKTAHVLVASHHGRENGCCDEAFSLTGWRPQIVLISDDYKQYDTQETVPWYRNRSSGISFDGGQRHVFTTRRDGAIFLHADNVSCFLETQRRVERRQPVAS